MFDIVMPLYNKEAFVGQTIESVLAQSFGEWRLHVVDDGSRDRGPTIVEAFREARISLHRQKNAGPAPARNAGIAAGSADWIALLDADDVWMPGHLAELDALRREFAEAVLIGTAYRRWHGHEAVKRAGPAAPGQSRLIRYFDEVARGRSPFFTSSAAFRREAVGIVGPFDNVLMGDETDLWARLALHGPVAASSRQTVLYRVDTGGLTDNYAGSDVEDARSMRIEDIGLPVATVMQRLPGIAERRLRDDLEHYLDYEVGVALLHALRAGRREQARKLLSLFLRGPRGKARAAVFLARLPWPWGRRLLFAIFRIKSALRRAARVG